MRYCNPPCSAAGTVNTTGATAPVVASFDLSALPGWAANVPVRVQAELHGRITSGGNVDKMGSAQGTRLFSVISSTVAAVTGLVGLGLGGVIVANAMPLSGDAAIIAALMSIDFSGSSVRVNATGIAATNITFTGFLWVSTGEF